MDTSDLDIEMLHEFQENDEWDECFNAMENWDKEQDLIAKSNVIDDEEAPRPEYLEVLHRCFGHKSFRPMQWKIISSIINDRKDNCSIMATGYGKSLCFQYPSVYIGGVTLVVSPLISLMEDQVLSLTMSNIPACLLGTAQTNKKQVLDEIFDSKYSLIYLTPEFCCGDYGQDLLMRMNQNLSIVLIAIDEAHCVSSWGHDFRYQYRELGKLRNILPNVPILAVTATATPKVRSDIVSSLKLRNPQVLCSGFDRPNLQFSVYLKGSAGIFPDLRKVMIDKEKSWGFPGSTIIYCITRKQTEEIAELLSLKGIKCLPYHAGLSIKARKEAHEKFVRDKVKIIIATIAFGMGIDKPDVRNIIHYGASKDIESYYQEVGRAGRDGQSSICVTFYRNSDFDLHQSIRELGGTNNTNRARREAMERIMIQYLETRDCRRQFILNHFEGSATPKKPKPKCCDNCTRKLHQTVSDSNKYEGLDEKGLYDFSNDARIFLGAVDALGGKFGLGMYILLVRGSRSSKLYERYHNHPLYGSGKLQSDEWWKAVGVEHRYFNEEILTFLQQNGHPRPKKKWHGVPRILDREGYLKKAGAKKGSKAFYSTYSVSDQGHRFMQNVVKNPGSTKILLQPTPEMFKLLKYKQQPEPPEEMLFKTTINPLPSTSKKSTTSSKSKPSLKLLKVQSRNDSVSEIKNDSDNVNESSETDVEKDGRMKVYRLLMNKRTDLASAVDCMPYMVASNEALMKMAQTKPLTINELRKCQLDGFTEAKINRFGEDFVKTIRIICQLDATFEDQDTKKSIQDILAEHPMPGPRMGATAEASYSMYKSGLTVQEIATKRGVLAATILVHLVDAMKAGYPIKMIDLNVTDEMRDIIISTIRNPPINSDMSVLTPIKNVCPPDITFDNIKVVVAFLQVREHLAKLKIPYEEFESPLETTSESHSSTQRNVNNESQSQSTKDLNCLLDFAYKNGDSSQRKTQPQSQTRKINLSSLTTKKCEKRDAESDSSDYFVSSGLNLNTDHPKKKQKLKTWESTSESANEFVLLDSPPRSTSSSGNTQKSNDEFAFLDSPPQTRKGNKQQVEVDLEKSLLEDDDFFDDDALNNVDKDIGEVKSNKNVLPVSQDEIRFNEQENVVSKSLSQNKSLTCSPTNNEDLKNKFKKFQFKSKVPKSVEQSTKQLCLQQSYSKSS